MSAEAVGPGLSAEDAANLALWERVLTELEDNLEAFSNSAGVSEKARELALSWQPPANLGPMPVEFASRSRMLALAQEKAYVQLRGESRKNRRQSALISSVPGPSSAAVYLDVAG
ncbi:hypothetical protein OL239_18320 [Arthrobacter sp. ATA002]|uniref:hypothetical protein n=1 Tax=Arthrobacter sp. ATA002 TaxID=2991715 RepID=UPI0022A74B3B|nr:hypothetical protein [Arthrobacter sp. ATA002]WAP51674.1 hypothetical protein OL239_18320 [Arthrobacter sp. ATA002]